MKPKTKADLIRAFDAEHPGLKASEAGKATGIDANYVALIRRLDAKRRRKGSKRAQEPRKVLGSTQGTPKAENRSTGPLEVQVGGSHYKSLAIQPVEYIHRNAIGYMEGNAIKYLTRWKAKGGVEDLKKAKHYIDLLIDMEEGKT